MNSAVRNMSLRDALLISAAVSGLCAPGAAQAQGAGGDVSEVVVTGSRIPRTTFSAPYPLATVSGEDIRSSGQISAADILAELPITGPSVNQQNTASSTFFAGQARVDLRNLGAQRTLVLVDDRRIPFGDASSPAADLNMIPTLMIERVDVVTGAASAIYGSEAIGGVVNFTMRNRFEGFEADAQVGVSEHGGGEEYRLGAIYGRKSGDGRLHAVIGAEASHSGKIDQNDRDFAYPGVRRNSTAAVQTVLANSKTNLSPYGVFQLNATTAVALDARNPSQVVRLSPACAPATVLPTCQDEALIYNTQYGVLQGRVNRGAIRGHVDYEVSERLNLFADLTFSRVEGYHALSPTFSGPGGGLLSLTIGGDNAFLNGPGDTAAALRAQFAAAGRPLTAATRVPVYRYFGELGGRDTDSRRSTTQIAGGMKGDFTAADREVRWNAYAQYGRMQGRVLTTGIGNITRIQQATDAIALGGQVVCRDAAARAAGCVPFDLVNGPSQLAVSWIGGVSAARQRSGQTVIAGSVTSELFDLPAGPLSIAAGAEYRRESSRFTQDALGASGALFTNAVGTRAGSYDVTEAYGEVRVPLLKDAPFAETLSVEAAGRLGHYSSVGDANQYRLAAEWAPVTDVRFRASQGTAVRAPNIVELFAPQSLTFVSGNNAPDPCDRLIFALATPAQQALRRVTCSAFIPSYNPATFTSNVGPGRPGGVALLQGGNPGLDAETAHTYSVGAVLKPRWVPGLMLSIDWFRYNVDRGISQLLPTTLVQLCYESSENPLTNPYCALIQRDRTGAATGGVLGGVVSITNNQLNLNKFKVEGYDYSASYRFTAGGFGDISLRADVTWTYRYELQGAPGQAYVNLANTIDRATPEWKGKATIGWARGPASAQWSTRYIGSMISTTALPRTALDPYYTGDYFIHDLRAQYDLANGVRLKGGVINITDRNPPALPETFSGSGQNLGASLYDNRGRYVFLGATFSY